MDYQVFHPAAVYALVAERWAQDCVVDNARLIRGVGTCFDRLDINPVQSCAVLYKQSRRMH